MYSNGVVFIHHSGVLKTQIQQSPVFGRESSNWESWWNTVVVNTFATAGVTTQQQQLQKVPYISQHLINHFSTSNAYTLLPSALSLLQFLSTKESIIVGAISNTDPRIDNVLSDLDIRHHFNFVLDAYTAGFAKPDPNIFKCAIEKSGLRNISPDEILHIGDSVHKDYIGARDLGWQSWLVDSDYNAQCVKHGLEVQYKTMYSSLNDVICALESKLI